MRYEIISRGEENREAARFASAKTKREGRPPGTVGFWRASPKVAAGDRLPKAGGGRASDYVLPL